MNFDSAVHFVSVIILPLLFAITIHEAAHGWAASKFGDKTALIMGRVTLNPIKHIDLLGTLIFPILMLILSKFTFTFGWAKPVPVVWQNLTKPRRDMALVALIGSFANLLMVFLWAIIAKLSIVLGNKVEDVIALEDIAIFFYNAGIFGILVNIVCSMLNLIPIPPLDGGRVVFAILPPKMAYRYSKIEPYGVWILLLLSVFGLFSRIFFPLTLYLAQFIRYLFGL
ncbi:site-2 protease family protein [Coxiella endosymbiont of Amblyomma americanum]|uniref:site-2 protease family protein n=1 Tax=Coxiella endosymbiont of Amblyomma americanum TaxID=325775 RepID=UPI000580768F|nr:site-2 protease family protein [Coxiella endosymbiont of Amblyomma americanum]AJC50204.1 peptidase M50 [Coxiella endosymbiont of Amblyomma americanum]AUJ58565.1 site-2 protease family protein [Coxiella-like endosymbiont of Amblyomma americanum]